MPKGSHGSFLVTLLFGVTVAIQPDAAVLAGGQGSAASAREAARKAAGYPPGCSTPVSERKTETGCYTTAETSLGVSALRYAVLAPLRVSEPSRRGGGSRTESRGRRVVRQALGLYHRGGKLASRER